MGEITEKMKRGLAISAAYAIVITGWERFNGGLLIRYRVDKPEGRDPEFRVAFFPKGREILSWSMICEGGE